MRTGFSADAYERACARIARLRADIGPGSPVFVDAKLGHYRHVYPATVVRRLASGRFLLDVATRGKTYRISIDSQRVARTEGDLYQRRATA